ncbi:MAG: efflux RND transporter periplasmic adaptor subunit [Verrucomicrobia bacterium]|nr:efflux RND transporter periplasmic adaptor subunit [Verrucomicrobiota bacterium]MBT7065572.1 efflux RND transporter periplasmic adaptor subunit [Verrucomicrobiota bacterium]MBT7701080.1 efflux RND transporter periplasmic adaptor subunit [Verrucomicrobiota bacterium]
MGLLVVGGLVLGAGCGREAEGPQTLTETARHEDLTVLIRASGEIRAADSNKIYPQLKGAGTIEFIVPEGERVTNSQVVARFATDEIEKLIRSHEVNELGQQNKLDAAVTALEIETMDNLKNLKLAEQAVTSTEMKLKKYREGDAPLAKRKARLQVETTARELKMKETRVRDIVGLLAEGFVTQDQVEEERIALEKAKVAHETAKVEETLNEQYTHPLREAEAVNAFEAATTDLEKTRKSGAVELRQKEQNVAALRRALEQTQEEVKEARAELTFCVVTAPTEGIVTYADPRRPWRRADVQVGARISRGQVLMTIPDMSGMIAAINVSEADIHRVRPGQKATVRSEALAEVVMLGEVKKVAEVANSGGWLGSDVKEFEVELALEDGKDLKPGFSCRVEIEAAHVAQALTLPLQAVFREQGALVVYRREKGQTERTVVEVGETSETRVEILSGVREGDAVLLVAPEA